MAELSVDAFVTEARAFLDANLPRKEAQKKFVWGEGSDAVGIFEEKTHEKEQQEIAAAKTWRQKKFDAGFGWVTGPAAFGGRELSQAHQRAYDALEGQYQAPNQVFFDISLGMVGPTILAHGSDVARNAYVRRLWRGEILGCQLFSEPGAGSDLASLQTKAERDGDEWVVTGQKVWTSRAHYSDIGEIIARTDPSLPKHRGLTGFVVDMRAPGVEIRPLRQMSGGAEFNEVFFNEVRIPDDHRLGDVNNGWNVALTTLMNERASIGAGGSGSGGLVNRVLEMARVFGVNNDPVIRQRLADLVVSVRVSNFSNQRAMDRLRAGQQPGPEMSMAKLAGTFHMQKINDLVQSIIGPRLVADTGEWGTYAWTQLLLGAPAGRIAGGSDEVMRNIIGERVLGLPKDPGIDTTSAFRDLKVGTQK